MLRPQIWCELIDDLSQALSNGPSSSAYTNASGTMIINPGDTVGASGDTVMDTMIVAQNGDEQSSDYLAALRAAAADDNRSASLAVCIPLVFSNQMNSR